MRLFMYRFLLLLMCEFVWLWMCEALLPLTWWRRSAKVFHVLSQSLSIFLVALLHNLWCHDHTDNCIEHNLLYRLRFCPQIWYTFRFCNHQRAVWGDPGNRKRSRILVAISILPYIPKTSSATIVGSPTRKNDLFYCIRNGSKYNRNPGH